MPKELYQTTAFRREGLEIIAKANEIIADYEAQGFILTLRQLYYQFVARDIIANKDTEYHRLGSIINKARLAGLIDWEAIEDRTRYLRTVSTWADPSSVIRAAAQSYATDLWAGQKYRPEVWIEKDALVGVIEGICNEYQVPFFACRGYSSQSEQWRAGKRMAAWADRGYQPIVFHFGDHDPSGVDMTRDNDERLSMFSEGQVEVHRLALNMKQIHQYSPPPNPTKMTDSRADDYIKNFGHSSWELDALEPSVIVSLIRRRIELLIDENRLAWETEKEKLAEEKAMLNRVSNDWRTIVENYR